MSSGWSYAAARAFAVPDAVSALKCPTCGGRESEYGFTCDDCGGSGLAKPRSRSADLTAADVRHPASVILIVERFDLTLIDMTVAGARLVVQPISRPEAMRLAHEENGIPYANNARGQDTIERELQLDASMRPTLRVGGRLLVMHVVRWNDVRWFLVTYESDGDGCVA